MRRNKLTLALLKTCSERNASLSCDAKATSSKLFQPNMAEFDGGTLELQADCTACNTDSLDEVLPYAVDLHFDCPTMTKYACLVSFARRLFTGCDDFCAIFAVDDRRGESTPPWPINSPAEPALFWHSTLGGRSNRHPPDVKTDRCCQQIEATATRCADGNLCRTFPCANSRQARRSAREPHRTPTRFQWD